MSSRKEVPGLVIVPELFKIVDPNKEHYATRYKIYADRARQKLKFADTFISDAKLGFSYTQSMFEDTVIFFTTEIQLRHKTTGDLEWCGESPLTRAVLRKDRFSSSGIIVTPEITVSNNDKTIDIDLSAYIRYEGVAVLESTDYIIDNEITGEVVFKRELDKENLYSLSVPTSILESGKVYRIRARYRDVLGKYSNYADAIFGLDNFLDLIFPEDNMYLMYGKTLILKPGVGNEPVFNGSDMKMVISDVNGVITTISYDNGFTINSLDYELGQILKCEISYGLKRKTINVFITKTELIEEYDPNFEIKGLYKTLDASTFLLTGVSTSKQHEDGYIYDINPNTGMLVRIAYDDVNNKLKLKENVIPIPGYITGYNHRAVFINPLGGLIVILSKEILYSYPIDQVDPNFQKIIFISKSNDGFYIDKTITLDHMFHGATHNNNVIIDGIFLIMYNRSYYNTRNKIKKIAINLLTKEIFDYGYIYTTNNNMLKGYSPIKINNKKLLFRIGVDESDKKDRVITSSASILLSDGTNLPILPKSGCLINDDQMIVNWNNTLDKTNTLDGYAWAMSFSRLIDSSGGFPSANSDAYSGMYKSPLNNKVYTIPTKDTYIRTIDVTTGVMTTIVNTTLIPNDAAIKFRYGCMGTDGKLYCSPHNLANKPIMIVNTANDTLDSAAVTSPVTTGAFLGACELDGYIYFSPYGENRIMSLKMSNKEVGYIPTGLTVNKNSYGPPCASKKYNKVIFTPHQDNRIMIYNKTTNEVSFIPFDPSIPVSALYAHAEIVDDRYVYFTPLAGKRFMILDLADSSIRFIDLPAAWSYYGALYNPKRRMFIISVVNGSTSGLLFLEVPFNNTNKVLLDIENTPREFKDMPNLISIKNPSLYGRLTTLKNGKPAYILAPSSDNTTSGVIEIDSESFALTDKRAAVNDTVPHRIVYTLQDGRIITANNNKAVLFY